ncbi:MAG: hypothetical protein K6A93_11475 [Bacteroidaceae bacterium]|nr:hypothetical protein [Bacteroidaceae bacterium]
MDKKKIMLLFMMGCTLLSCRQSSSNTRPVVLMEPEDTLPTDEEVLGELNNDVPMEETMGDEEQIPLEYTNRKIDAYVPQNDQERNLLSDLHELEEAQANLDYKKVVSLCYPDFFKLLQEKVPEKSIDELKKVYEEHLEMTLEAWNNEFLDSWQNAKRAGVCVTDIKNRVREGNKLLYLYEYHTVLYSDSSCIYKQEAEYSVAVSLNNGKKWYSTPNGINDLWEILSYSFSEQSIDQVLRK